MSPSKRVVGSKVVLNVVAAAILLLPALPARGIDEADAISDWKALAEADELMKVKVGEVVPDYAPNIIGSEHAEILATLNGFDEADRPGVEKLLDRVEKRYGSTPSEINEAMASAIEIDWRSGKHPREQAGAIYERLRGWLANIDEARMNRSAELFRDSEYSRDSLVGGDDRITAERYDALAAKLEAAIGYDPDNDQAREALKNLDEDRKETFSALEKAIDEAVFPGHFENFAGPGDPDDLAASVLEYLRADETSRGDEDPDHTLAVSIRGDWVSAKKNILGQTIQWGLPIWGVAHNSAQKKEDIARVWGLTVITREEAGVEKAPPWTGIWVGDSYKMRLSNVKVSGGGKASGGFFGRVFWLALVGVNVLAGMVLAAPFLRSRLPQMAGVLDVLSPQGGVIGVAALSVGVLALLKTTLFQFAPLSDLLPQLSAIVAGLLLGKGLLLRKPAFAEEPPAIGQTEPEEDLAHKTLEAAESATLKAQEFLAKHDAQLENAKAQAVPLGLTCLVLGLLHLVMGGVGLF